MSESMIQQFASRLARVEQVVLPKGEPIAVEDLVEKQRQRKKLRVELDSLEAAEAKRAAEHNEASTAREQEIKSLQGRLQVLAAEARAHFADGMGASCAYDRKRSRLA